MLPKELRSRSRKEKLGEIYQFNITMLGSRSLLGIHEAGRRQIGKGHPGKAMSYGRISVP